MPYLDLASHRLHYRVDGAVEEAANKPWLLFCNSLGTDLHMWDLQVPALSKHYQILRYDRRGHGLSTTPKPPYQLSDLGGDVLALLDALNISNTHFCGLSIGGLTGQWLGVNAGERFDRLVFCATAPKIGTQESWNERIELVQNNGLAALRDGTAERWFSPEFRAAQPKIVSDILDRFVSTSVEGYVGCCAALGSADLTDDIKRITNPVLAISGSDDAVCPPSDLELIARSVNNGIHTSLQGRHIVNAESASEFTKALVGFLQN